MLNLLLHIKLNTISHRFILEAKLNNSKFNYIYILTDSFTKGLLICKLRMFNFYFQPKRARKKD